MTNESLDLFHEAQTLLDRIDRQIAACYELHPHLGEVVRPGQTPRRLGRLRQVRFRALRRYNRRRAAAGLPMMIAGAMWMINQADSGYF